MCDLFRILSCLTELFFCSTYPHDRFRQGTLSRRRSQRLLLCLWLSSNVATSYLKLPRGMGLLVCIPPFHTIVAVMLGDLQPCLLALTYWYLRESTRLLPAADSPTRHNTDVILDDLTTGLNPQLEPADTSVSIAEWCYRRYMGEHLAITLYKHTPYQLANIVVPGSSSLSLLQDPGLVGPTHKAQPVHLGRHPYVHTYVRTCVYLQVATSWGKPMYVHYILYPSVANSRGTSSFLRVCTSPTRVRLWQA